MGGNRCLSRLARSLAPIGICRFDVASQRHALESVHSDAVGRALLFAPAHGSADSPTEGRRNAKCVRRRGVARQISDMITAEKNRLRGKSNIVQSNISEHIEWLEEKLKAIESQIQNTVAFCEDWKQKQKLLTSVPRRQSLIW